jgi:uncharacterized membrane protein YidH (DUF202 family)
VTAPGGGSDDDPGLARERTQLAWTRTAIAFAGLGGALAKFSPVEGIPLLAMAPLVWGLGRLPGGGRPGMRLLVVATAVTGISLAALAIAVFAHPTSGIGSG